MKSLIILGVPRAGKSTLATSVARKLSETGNAISLINADAVMGGLTAERGGHTTYKYLIRPLYHIIPGMRKRCKKRLHRNFVDFIGRFLDETAQNSIVIYEGAYITPTQAVKIFDTKKFKIVAIGYPNITPEDKCRNVCQFDDRSPIKCLGDKKMFERISRLIKVSQEHQKQCQKYNLRFIDTSSDYLGAIESFTDDICDFLRD